MHYLNTIKFVGNALIVWKNDFIIIVLATVLHIFFHVYVFLLNISLSSTYDILLKELLIDRTKKYL